VEVVKERHNIVAITKADTHYLLHRVQLMDKMLHIYCYVQFFKIKYMAQNMTRGVMQVPEMCQIHTLNSRVLLCLFRDK